MNQTRLANWIAAAILGAFALAGLARSEDAAARAGLLVVVGADRADERVSKWRNRAHLVHVLDIDAGKVDAARGALRSLGAYGPLSVDVFDGEHLPYVDNLVNLVEADELGAVPMEEVMRVLAPNGAALVGGQKTVKPWPDDIDEWPHWRYGPDNLSVSRDRVAGPPRHVQWINGPRWGRHHESSDTTPAIVSADGRVYVVDDFGPAGIRTGDIPAQCVLRAIDAFNGVVLWQRPVSWTVPNTRPGTPYPDRMLVADGATVLVAPGDGKPIEVLDGASGKTLRTLPGTEGAVEFIVTDDSIYVNALDDSARSRQKDRRFSRKRGSLLLPVRTMAVDRATGRIRWQHPSKHIMPQTLVCRGNRVCLMLDDESVTALDAATGQELWTASPPPSQKPSLGWLPWALHSLAMSDAVVLTHTAQGQTAFDAASGRVLWNREPPTKERFGLLAPHDFFLRDGLLWLLPTNIYLPSGGKSELQGVDPVTGKVIKTINVGRLQAGHHWRCYPNRATDRYIFGARRGVETVAWGDGAISLQPWTRGACRQGIIPANGLLYMTPHPCACAVWVKLNGLYALAPERSGFKPSTQEAVKAASVQEGPAWGSLVPSALPPEWATYRGGIERGAVTETGLGSTLNPLWKADVGEGVTPPTVGYGLVFAGSARKCLMAAYSRQDGRPRWSMNLPGPVDTPPTLHKGLALFGCRDGTVYAVRASDGVLAWRRRIMPQDRRIVAEGRIESTWPVHGGVLLWGDTAYVLAGRQSYVDGGMMLVALDPVSGAVKQCVAVANDPDLDKNTNLIPGTIADVLSVSSDVLYLNMQYAFAPDLRAATVSPHLFAIGGMLDDSWHNRTGWTVGGILRWSPKGSNADGSRLAHNLVVDGHAIYGLKAFTSDVRASRFKPGGAGYTLFAAALKTDDAQPKKKKRRGRRRKDNTAGTEWVWERKVPVRGSALVKASDKLVYAGAPDKVIENDPWASFEGRAGGILVLASAADGRELAKMQIESPPVFNGMAVTENRVWLTTEDGFLRAFGAE